jgi:hypothetical protein
MAAVVAADTANRSSAPPPAAARRRILSLILFGVAFGYLEASVVVYLRAIGQPIRTAAGYSSQDLFPLLRLDQLPLVLTTLLKIELGREAATLIMLAAVAAAVSRGFRSWLAAFVLAFGVWDLTFYAWLRVLIGWPASIITWDLLFLLPVPWAAPVLAPVIVAATMSVFGAWMLAREPEGASRYAGPLLALGAVILFVSFIWDWRNLMNGAAPAHFPWANFCYISNPAVTLFGAQASRLP